MKSISTFGETQGDMVPLITESVTTSPITALPGFSPTHVTIVRSDCLISRIGDTAMTGSLNPAFHRETVLGSGVGDERVVRQHGSTGVYAGIRIEVRSLARGKGTVFAWNAGANIPARFAISVAQGVRDAMGMGVLAGLELTDVLVSVEDGSYHEEDSSEAAFREVTQRATTAALRQAHPTVLEAISVCRTAFPKEYASAIEESLSSEEVRIESAQSESQTSGLIVTVPTSRVDSLLQQILSVTHGQAKFLIESGGFRPRPEPPEMANVWTSVP